jgi:hypothetical protein
MKDKDNDKDNDKEHFYPWMPNIHVIAITVLGLCSLLLGYLKVKGWIETSWVTVFMLIPSLYISLGMIGLSLAFFDWLESKL